MYSLFQSCCFDFTLFEGNRLNRVSSSDTRLEHLWEALHSLHWREVGERGGNPPRKCPKCHYCPYIVHYF